MAERSIKFISEQSLAAFILALPGKVAFEVQETQPGRFTLTFL